MTAATDSAVSVAVTLYRGRNHALSFAGNLSLVKTARYPACLRRRSA